MLPVAFPTGSIGRVLKQSASATRLARFAVYSISTSFHVDL